MTGPTLHPSIAGEEEGREAFSLGGDMEDVTRSTLTADQSIPGGEEVFSRGGEGMTGSTPTADQSIPGGEGEGVGEEVFSRGGEGMTGSTPTADQSIPGGEGEGVGEGEVEVFSRGGEGMTGSTPTTDQSIPRGEGVGEGEVEVLSRGGGVTGPTLTVGHEFRDIDLKDVEKVDEFCKNGCGCTMRCSTKFSVKHYLATRANSQQLDRKELEMAVMGQVMAFTFCNQLQNTTQYRHRPKQRERNTSMFYHNGVRVCKNTFLFLHDIGNFRLKAIRAHYLSEGLVPHIHGHTGRTAPNALVLGDIKGLITFVMHYFESNGILLPGRIPGYKRDDIKLLPSSCTKRAVWMLYQDSAISLSLHSVAYTTFCKVWRNFLESFGEPGDASCFQGIILSYNT